MGFGLGPRMVIVTMLGYERRYRQFLSSIRGLLLSTFNLQLAVLRLDLEGV